MVREVHTEVTLKQNPGSGKEVNQIYLGKEGFPGEVTGARDSSKNNKKATQ